MTQWGLDNLFNPGKRHMDDEKRRLQSTREEIGDNSGGRRIDLEGGKVSISVPRRPAQPAGDDTAAVDLDPALEAEEVPAVALGSDETEIEPVLVDDTADDTRTETPAPEPVAARPEPAGAPAPEPVAAADEPVAAEPEPTPAPAKRRTLSASAWSRRG